jgi:hypothetical protein
MKQTNLFLSMLLLAAMALIPTGTKAQVTIGSLELPHAKALLDLKENASGTSTKGLILPRVSLLSVTDFLGSTTGHQEGTIVYNTNTSAASVPAEDRVSPGFYYNNGTKWEKLPLSYTNWFYMPSIAINTQVIGTATPINLYDKYVEQFTLADAATSAKSTGAPEIISYLPLPSDLYYYITYYDKEVFEDVTISDSGVLNYKIKQIASDSSYVNIVFVLK